MTSKKLVFDESGPVHLTTVNWDCPDHQRSVAASLVQGTYALERDRQLGHKGPEALAPPWWERFHFQVIQKLVDDADSSIFGAVYELKPPAGLPESSVIEAPRFVIAFRGTVIKKATSFRDFTLDLHFIMNRLHKKSRFKKAMQAAGELVETSGHQNVWVAGHSLGAAIAILAGKNMAKEGVNLKAFIFNPPHFSLPTERIKNKKVKDRIRIVCSFVTAGLALAMEGRRQRSDSFAMLSSWVPCLFVNKADDICSGFIGYFEQRKKMEEIGAGDVGKLATQHSVRGIVLSAIGVESESPQLLPSAKLTVNSSPAPDFKHAHGIRQWWRPDLALQSKEYLYH